MAAFLSSLGSLANDLIQTADAYDSVEARQRVLAAGGVAAHVMTHDRATLSQRNMGATLVLRAERMLGEMPRTQPQPQQNLSPSAHTAPGLRN